MTPTAENCSNSSTCPWPADFSQRLTDTGAICWSYDDAGHIAAISTSSTAIRTLLQSAPFTAAVAAANTQLQSSLAAGLDPQSPRSFASAAVFPGVHILLGSPDPLAGPILALAAGRDGVTSHAFVAHCRSLGLDAAALVEELRPSLRESAGDARILAASLLASLGDLTRLDSLQHVSADFSERLSQAYEETYTLFRIMRFMASDGEARGLVNLLIEHVNRALPMGVVAVQFADVDGVTPSLRDQTVMVGNPGCEISQLSAAMASLASGARKDNWTRILEPSRDPLAQLLKSEVICEPVTYAGRVIGILLAGRKYGPDPMIASPEMQFLEAVADYLGTFHENIARFEEQRLMSLGVLKALTASIDAKDPYTRGHSERVAYISCQVASFMGYTPDQVERVRIAGMVHDVGKIGVPEAVLLKQGRLTDDEFAAIKRHPEVGHVILRDIPGMADILPGVLHHHERFDGRGYPHALKAEAIPMVARIICIADTFDAMSSTRSYRAALPREKVLAEIQRCAGSQFDPVVVEAFMKVNLTGYDRLLDQQRALSPWSPDAATAVTFENGAPAHRAA